MAGKSNEKISGYRLAKLRLKLGLAQKDLGDAIGISPGRIQQLERKKSVGMYSRNFRRLAEVAKLSVEELREQIGYQDLADQIAAGAPTGEVDEELTGRDVKSKGMIVVPILNAKAPLVMPPVVPVINSVSASRMDEKTDLGYPPGFADRYLDISGLDCFALICEGDCMEPDWHDRELVLFSQNHIRNHGVQDGDDVCVQLYGEDDGENTFKRAFLDGREALILKCVNPKYRTKQRITWDRIARIGKAIWAMRSAR